MKKVSILSLHLGYGGIEKSVAALANMLVDDYEVEIACTYKLFEKSVFPVDDRVKIVYLTSVKPNRDKIKKALRKKQLFKLVKETFYALKVLRLREKTMISYIKNCDSDVVIATRDIFDEWLGKYGQDKVLKIGWEHNHYHGDFKYAANITRSNKQLDYLVLVSNSLRAFYEKELIKFKCQVVYIPNVIEGIPEKIAPLDEKRLVSVGRLSPEKGFIDLLKMFNILHKDYPDWRLDIIGDGVEKDKLEKYIKDHDLEKVVLLHGFRDKEYIDEILQKSAIYLLTSYTESFGIVLIEAMSHGVPCIAFDSAEGARELIQSGKNGYLIKNRSYSAFLKKVEDLINKKSERRKIGRVSREGVKKYTCEVVKEQWIDLIEKK
ncbi:MAG: glycosyltransferase [Mycoplasmatota bacterium]|nr:glycosyltransferase [Mycoplasmatota bacterium]